MSQTRIIKVTAKCSDCIMVECGDHELDGTSPSFLGGPDYVAIEIDADTGRILNWPGADKAIAEIKGDRDE